MKRVFSKENIIAVLLLLLSVAQTVSAALWLALAWRYIAIFQFMSIIAILFIRFNYSIAYYSNTWQAFWRRENTDSANDEPSKFAIVSTKVVGYAILFMIAVFYLIIASNQSAF